MLRQKPKKKNKLPTALIVTALVATYVIYMISYYQDTHRTYTEEIIMVSSYDGQGTLWDIAKKYCPDYIETGDYIEYIKMDNDCTSVIHNGDRLTVRIYEE